MQQPTHDAPHQGSPPPTRFAWPFAVHPARIIWHAAMAVVRPAAAVMAGWSLYVVAIHYGMPQLLAVFCVAVFDGIGMGCLYQATEAVRAGRSAFAAILATLGMASVSVYLNVQHAQIINRGLPAEIMFATPAVGLLILSALSWSATRAAARAARGESPLRLPAYGLWGWLLAPQQAADALQQRARTHVTSSASPAHQAASPHPRTAHAALAEKFAAMDPAAAIEIAAGSHPQLDPADLAQLLAAYGVTVDALEVALVLGRAAAPSVTLNRMPDSPAELTKGLLATGPAIGSDTPISEAIVSIHRYLPGRADAKTVVQQLALHGKATDTAYVRTTLSRAKAKAADEAAREDARRAQASAAPGPNQGTGGYL